MEHISSETELQNYCNPTASFAKSETAIQSKQVSAPCCSLKWYDAMWADEMMVG